MNIKEQDLREVLKLQKPGEGCKNYSIKAGAGGGKTTLLSHRICKQIIDGTPIDQFVIITYTVAAAMELRAKISDRLLETSVSATSSDEEKNRAREALNSIELMQISTIHAFLLKLLREHAFEAGLVLDAELLEEDELRKEEFFGSWYKDHYAQIYQFQWLHHIGTSNRDVDVTREVMLNMFKDIVDVREKIFLSPGSHQAQIDVTATNYLTTWLQPMIIFKNEVISNNPMKKNGNPVDYVKATGQLIDAVTEVESLKNSGSTDQVKMATTLSTAVSIVKECADQGKTIYRANYKAENAVIDTKMKALPKFPAYEWEWDFEKLYHDYMEKAEAATAIAEYALQIRDAYRDKYDQETVQLTNNDILFRADRLLSDHPEVLDQVRASYSKIYVDEFQDTTSLQARLVMMLSEKVGTPAGSGNLQEDKLVVVGDAKQSIYRFTGAEKDVYDQVDQKLAQKNQSISESVDLKTNFRSNEKIVNWVNSKFSVLMGAGYSAMDTDWTISDPNALQGVYGYVSAEDKYGKEQDVAAVVKLVQDLVDPGKNQNKVYLEEPDRHPDGTFGTPKLRKIEYSDIMIIFKNATRITEYVEGFARAGIPVNVQGKFKVDKDEILKNFLLLAEYIADYKNKKARMTAIQILGGLDATIAEDQEIDTVENKLKDLRTKFREKAMDPAAILRYLLAQEDLFLPRDVAFPPERVREYRIRLNQMVESCLQENDGDLSHLVSLMKEYMEGEIKRQIPLESQENSLRLMNVHQAKGLTGQVVIIADRSNAEGSRYGGFRSKGIYYPTVTYKESALENAKTKYYPSYGWDVNLLKLAADEDEEEAIRLQYVAATRAAHALIIMPVVVGRGTPNAWFSAPAYQYDKLPDINAWIKERVEDPAGSSVAGGSAASNYSSINLHDLETQKAAANLSKMGEVQLISITPSGLEPEGRTGYTSEDAGYVQEDRPRGDVFGTVMHRAYELLFIRFEKLAKLQPGDLENAIERAVNQAILESKEEMDSDSTGKWIFDYLKPKMIAYFEPVIKGIMAEAAEIYPEYAFSFYVAEEEKEVFKDQFNPYLSQLKNPVEIRDEVIWVNGKADLVVRKKDGSIKVYDYKSDAMNGKPEADFKDALAKKYGGQLALYRYAIGKSFGVSNVETELITLYRA